MKRSHIIVIVVAILFVGLGAWLLSEPKQTNNRAAESSSSQVQEDIPTKTSTTTTTSPQEYYTLAQVADHSTTDDCWTVIDGSVYDLTSFIRNHPGGQNILSACGNDATSYWAGQQSGQLGESNDHRSDNQASELLSELKIGELKR